MPITKLQLEAAKSEAYDQGYRDAQQAKFKAIEKEQAFELRKQQIDLMRVVGQTIDSLARVYDCGPRV